MRTEENNGKHLLIIVVVVAAVAPSDEALAILSFFALRRRHTIVLGFYYHSTAASRSKELLNCRPSPHPTTRSLTLTLCRILTKGLLWRAALLRRCFERVWSL